MTELTMPKFNFSDNITDAEIQAELNANNTPKFFEPGSYDLRIKGAEVKGPSKSDPTWITVALELESSDGRSIRHYLLVPTASLRFQTKSGKNQLFVYTKLREFLAGIGENGSADEIRKVIPKLFTNPEVLTGRAVTVDVGFDGYHVARMADKTYKLLDRKGQDVNNLTFPDRDAAIAAAADLGIEVKKFANVLKFHEAASIDESDDDNWA